MNQGELYLVATPIGNLEDMTFRAVRILQTVDVIACEDTRRTQKLCYHFDIKTRLESYHEHNEHTKSKRLIERLLNGQSIALVSDAGMPAISDPGRFLVQTAVMAGIKIIPLPGACAAITGLVASGLDSSHFLFAGFLPREKKARLAQLKAWQYYSETFIFYISPHRFAEVVADIQEVWGNDRDVVVARELTKLHESFWHTQLGDEALMTTPQIGEICFIVTGAKQRDADEAPMNDWPLMEHIAFYIQSGLKRNEAMKRVAKDRHIGKREVYRQVLEIEGRV